MSLQHGSNGGVTGLVDITGTPKFTAKIIRFSETLALSPRGKNGRGGSRWRQHRWCMPGGQLAVSGYVRKDNWPMPTQLRGEAGTITLQFDAGLTQAVAVVVHVC